MEKRHSDPRTISTALGRRQYFMDFRAAKLGHATPEIRAERYSATCGGDSIRAFPQEKPAIDLLTCENDILACGAKDVLTHEFGMRVPQDIAIVGFDNLELSGAPPCDLTTYGQPMDEMAGASVDMILGRRPKKPVTYPGTLIVRRSTRRTMAASSLGRIMRFTKEKVWPIFSGSLFARARRLRRKAALHQVAHETLIGNALGGGAGFDLGQERLRQPHVNTGVFFDEFKLGPLESG
jgi:Periplasmic binding protein-like domain